MISPKPRAAVSGPDRDNEAHVEALINKGGTTSGEQSRKLQEKTAAIVLRLPGEMLEQIDKLVKARPVRTPRHMWLVEAVYEKIGRESGSAQ